MGESLLPWTLSPIGDEIPKSSPSDLKMTLSFAIIGIIVAAILNLKTTPGLKNNGIPGIFLY